MDKKVEIFIATHKPITAELPEGYVKAQVNCANSGEHWDGYVHDDSGQNISLKNPNYSELSVMYWAWKNSDADIKGLMHYRRMMSKKNECEFKSIDYGDIENLSDRILEKDEIIGYLNDADVLLTMPYGPYPITAREELEKFVYKHDIEIMEDVLKDNYPEYYKVYNEIMQMKNLSYFNMLVSSDQTFDGYCEWIFDVLAKIEQKCDLTGYDKQHSRIYGYFSEVLQNVYIEKNRLKKKYFILLNPYQMKEASAESYAEIIQRERQFDVLRKMRLGFVEKYYYKVKHPDAYAQWDACRKFINREQRNPNE